MSGLHLPGSGNAVGQTGKVMPDGFVPADCYALESHMNVRDSRCKTTERWSHIDKSQMRFEENEVLYKYVNCDGFPHDQTVAVPYVFAGVNGMLKDMATRIVPIGIAEETYIPSRTEKNKKLSMAIRRQARAVLRGSPRRMHFEVHAGQTLMAYVQTADDLKHNLYDYCAEQPKHGWTPRDMPFPVPLSMFNAQVYCRDDATSRAMAEVTKLFKTQRDQLRNSEARRISLLAEDGRDASLVWDQLDDEVMALMKDHLLERQNVDEDLRVLLDRTMLVRHVDFEKQVMPAYDKQLHIFLRDACATGDYFGGQVNCQFLQQVMQAEMYHREAGVQNTSLVSRQDCAMQLQLSTLQTSGALAQADIATKGNKVLGMATTNGGHRDAVNFFFDPAYRRM